MLDGAARGGLLADAVRVPAAGGATEVIADVDAQRAAASADLARCGFRQVRARVLFEPAAVPRQEPPQITCSGRVTGAGASLGAGAETPPTPRQAAHKS
ncbi:hypothetical protein [Microbispora sp. NPDC049633]|uniref:hypothetical protein n=1 Tax=Microbispora sp. NPDC049633 TaxID=3154355 RepID=UPI00343C6DEC